MLAEHNPLCRGIARFQAFHQIVSQSCLARTRWTYQHERVLLKYLVPDLTEIRWENWLIIPRKTPSTLKD
jgi:hypothetical protein